MGRLLPARHRRELPRAGRLARAGLARRTTPRWPNSAALRKTSLRSTFSSYSGRSRLGRNTGAARDEKKALGHPDGPHYRLRVLAVLHPLVRPNSEHHGVGLVPMAVQVEYAPVVAPHHPGHVALVLPGDVLERGDLLDQVVIVGGQQRQVQGGQRLDDRGVFRGKFSKVSRSQRASSPPPCSPTWWTSSAVASNSPGIA